MPYLYSTDPIHQWYELTRFEPDEDDEFNSATTQLGDAWAEETQDADETRKLSATEEE